MSCQLWVGGRCKVQDVLGIDTKFRIMLVFFICKATTECESAQHVGSRPSLLTASSVRLPKYKCCGKAEQG